MNKNKRKAEVECIKCMAMCWATYGCGASSALSMERVRPCRLTLMWLSWLLVSLVYSCSVSWRISSSLATELPVDWKPGRTVVVLPAACGTKETPEWPLEAGVGGFGVGVATGSAGLTGCTGVGSGDCQAEGDVGVLGVPAPGERGVGNGG